MSNEWLKEKHTMTNQHGNLPNPTTYLENEDGKIISFIYQIGRVDNDIGTVGELTPGLTLSKQLGTMRPKHPAV